MTETHQTYVAAQYAPRAADYLASPVHAAGADLDRIEHLLDGQAGARVLDLGCGGGHVSYRAARHVAEVVACDITPDMLETVRAEARARGLANIETRLAAAEALPFEAASFDWVLSRFSAHHWHDLAAGLREVRRVLRPGGQAVFVDTVAPADPLLDTHLQAIELLRDASHVRNYGMAEWVQALGAAGLAVTSLAPGRLALGFDAWIARTRTPAPHVASLRLLQQQAPQAVRDRLAVLPDGSFTLDTLTIVAC